MLDASSAAFVSKSEFFEVGVVSALLAHDVKKNIAVIAIPIVFFINR
jgi:hypothetical protein